MRRLHHLLALLALGIAPAELSGQSERMTRLPLGDGVVAYHVTGAGVGTPLVIINGGPGLDHRYLHISDVWRRFGPTRRVVLFDQPGTGQSSPIGAQDTITIERVLDGIEAIRGALGAGRVHLLGHSWGGYLALAYAIRHPDRVSRIVLVGSAAPDWSSTEVLFASLFPDSLERGAAWRLDDPKGLQEDFRRHVYMGMQSPEARSRVLAKLDSLPYNRRHGQLLVAQARAYDLKPLIAGIAVPTLVTTGRYDANIAPRTSWLIHRAIPGSRFAVFERSGHYPMFEEPDAFVAVVERFLRAP
jgi:proline iminopeptidase